MRVLILLLLLSGAAQAETRFFFEFGIGKNSGDNWEDCDHLGTPFGLGGTGVVSKHLHWEIKVEHNSQYLCGATIGVDDESELNHFGGKLRYYF